MKIDGWETFGDPEKPIHRWIECHPDEPIPEDMKYSGWENDEMTRFVIEHSKNIHRRRYEIRRNV